MDGDPHDGDRFGDSLVSDDLHTIDMASCAFGIAIGSSHDLRFGLALQCHPSSDQASRLFPGKHNRFAYSYFIVRMSKDLSGEFSDRVGLNVDRVIDP